MADIKVKTQQYVCFNKESGEIFSIGPNINSNYEQGITLFLATKLINMLFPFLILSKV